jgi:SWI/SNF-related matrix-associated actin-dependent regulator of chromatin subfamily A member 5
MRQKLASMGETTLRNFTLDAPGTDSVYQFEGEDYRWDIIRCLQEQAVAR